MRESTILLLNLWADFASSTINEPPPRHTQPAIIADR